MQKLLEMTGSLEKLAGVEEEEESGSSVHGAVVKTSVTVATWNI